MKYSKFGILFLLGSFILTSCAARKMSKALTVHDENLKSVLGEQINPEEKLDVMIETFVTVFEESLEYNSAKKSINYINKFSNDNKRTLELLFNQLEGWMGEKNALEQISTLAQLASKPYSKRLIEIVPKFEKKVNRKIKQFNMVAKLLSIIKPRF